VSFFDKQRAATINIAGTGNGNNNANSLKPSARKKSAEQCSVRFEAANIDSLFEVLDAIAWLNSPDTAQVSQFAGVDPRTAGKLLKNSITIGLVDSVDGEQYRLKLAYPFKGSLDQKRAVVREALVRMPLLTNVRQFLTLGERLEAAIRKAATVVQVTNYDSTSIAPLIKWAQELKALEPGMVVEDLLQGAVEAKEQRHREDTGSRVAFLSHSSKDKPIIRQIASDLTAEGITVWLDELRVHVGDSIPDQIAQGLAEADFFLIALSENSVQSEWVRRELNQALLKEIEKRKVVIMPLKLSDCEIPSLIKDKKYADFSKSYREGISALLHSIKAKSKAS
jgi:hypothetical protein